MEWSEYMPALARRGGEDLADHPHRRIAGEVMVGISFVAPGFSPASAAGDARLKSGATYGSIASARPKSSTFTVSSARTLLFCGSRSRWTMA
jgi:hypothetical protein